MRKIALLLAAQAAQERADVAGSANDDLPAGWHEAKAPDGRSYYYAQGAPTRWIRPTEREPAGR